MPGRNSEELQQADTASGPGSLHIEAENYLYQSGAIASETCSDAGGGQDLTNIGGSYYAVYSVTVAQAGTYLVKFRVAGSGGSFQFKDSSLNVLATVTVPNTGSSQTWQTITATVVLRAGTQQVHFYCTQPGWNLNWLEFVFRAGTSNSSSSGGGGYRYGFNGKEKDNEVSGDGNQYDYGFRIYNPRIGRFLSVDPLAKSYPWFTPYQFAGNKPIIAIDLDGLEDFDFREICKDDGSVLVFITTGKSTLFQSHLQVSTATGVPPTPYFKYKKIQEEMSKAKNFSSIYSSGKETTENETGFTFDIPESPIMIAHHSKSQEKTPGLLHDITSLVFQLTPAQQDIYFPENTGKAGTNLDDNSGWVWGNAQFEYNTELTSGEVVFKYDNDKIADNYVFTDEDGNKIYETGDKKGKGEVTFQFNNLKIPKIKVAVTSSDKKLPENSVWNFTITIKETDKQKDERKEKQKEEVPCVVPEQ